MANFLHRIGAVPFLGTVFLCYAGASILWSPGEKVWATTLLLGLAAAFVVGATIKDERPIWIAVLTFVGMNILAMLFIDQLPWGLFGNPNYLGCAITIALAGALAYEWYLFLPIDFVGLFFTQSRGAILAAGLMGIMALWHRSKWLACCVALAIVPMVLGTKPDAISSVVARLGVWQDTLNHLTFFGHGFNSFFETYQTWPVHLNMTLQLPTHVYNDFVEAIFDFGVGAIPLLVMIVLILDRADFGQRLICLTFLALGLTYYPLHIVPVGLLFFMTLGRATQGASNEMASRHAPSYRRASARSGDYYWG